MNLASQPQPRVAQILGSRQVAPRFSGSHCIRIPLVLGTVQPSQYVRGANAMGSGRFLLEIGLESTGQGPRKMIRNEEHMKAPRKCADRKAGLAPTLR